ncbi:Protein lin-7 C [Biomphalaria pfeifferi]|uniref:Protein lin-7 C n=1 Tax=Biomphalaria pfeifferi TaxID=112525 RepID=A0AAD8BCJ3_BIOPF|nr:Protein lin-7 C [Biomphalaria pfeifferi]
MNSERRTRANSQVWFVGTVNSSITQEGRLPTLRDVLSVFFYRHIEEKLTLSESADIAVMELLKIWKKSGIPTSFDYNIKNRLLKVHKEWQMLKKSKNRRSETQLENEKNFCDQLDLLFDVAHQEARNLIAVPEDWEFLVAQREGQRGYMAGIDRDAERKKEMSNKKEQDIKKRKERSDREVAALLEKETCELSCESSTPEQSDEEYNHVGPRKKKVCQLE